MGNKISMTFLIPCLSLLSSLVPPNEKVLQSAVLSFQIICVYSDHDDDRKFRLFWTQMYWAAHTYPEAQSHCAGGKISGFLRNTPMKTLMNPR